MTCSILSIIVVATYRLCKLRGHLPVTLFCTVSIAACLNLLLLLLLVVANCADERGQTDRQYHFLLAKTGLFHHCWASPAAGGQIVSKII